MKRQLFFIGVIAVLIAAPGIAESLDTFKIVRENTGNTATMVTLDKPFLKPNQTIFILMEQAGLSGKWGEGYVTWSYSYYSTSGTKIWTSKDQSAKKLTKEATWDLSSVLDITLPDSIPDGEYRIQLNLKDYHTNKEYLGSVFFTVGEVKTSRSEKVQSLPTNKAESDQKNNASQSKKDDFVITIGETEIELLSVEIIDFDLIFTFRGLNNGYELNTIFVNTDRIFFIDSTGKEVHYSKGNGDMHLKKLAPGVETKITFSMKIPKQVSNELAYFRFSFGLNSWGTDYIWKNIYLPYSAK